MLNKKITSTHIIFLFSLSTALATGKFFCEETNPATGEIPCEPTTHRTKLQSKDNRLKLSDSVRKIFGIGHLHIHYNQKQSDYKEFLYLANELTLDVKTKTFAKKTVSGRISVYFT